MLNVDTSNLLSNSVCKLITSDILCVCAVAIRLLNEVWCGLFVSPVCDIKSVLSVLPSICVCTLPL